MNIKKMVPVLFILGFVLIAVSIVVMKPGTWRSSVMFLGFVSAIAAMIMRIASMTKRN